MVRVDLKPNHIISNYWMKDVPVGPCGPLKPGRPCTAIDKFSDFSNEIKTHIISIDWNKSFTLTLPPHLNSAKHPRVFLCCFETKTAWTQLRNKTPLKISIHRVIVVVSRYCLQSWYYLQRKKKKKDPRITFFSPSLSQSSTWWEWRESFLPVCDYLMYWDGRKRSEMIELRNWLWYDVRNGTTE